MNQESAEQTEKTIQENENIEQKDYSEDISDPELTHEEKLEEDLAKEKDKFLRLFAEFENYKKRTAKERIELFKTANQEVLEALLPILDDFDRALNQISKSEDEAHKRGIELIYDKLKNTLESKGLEQVEVNVGDVFDVDFAEAITHIQAPSEELKGKIVDVVEKGYKLGNKIIRYPKVVTGM
ncbi:MAG TPA: nucleotide exchange factor GrpE [Flavobacterium sp.]|nr:nucleotide exchange factor GrpE [Flavobacterium sp.]